MQTADSIFHINIKRCSMKRILSALVLCALFVTVYAAGGPEDPLASLSYLNGPFTDGLHTAVDARLNAASFSTTSAVTPACRQISILFCSTV